MGMLAWVMMGLAIWHFTIFLPDRFWGGIVGAFLGALIGAVLFGLIVNGFTVPGRHDTDLRDGARGDPRRADRDGASVYFEGIRRERAGAGTRQPLGLPSRRRERATRRSVGRAPYAARVADAAPPIAPPSTGPRPRACARSGAPAAAAAAAPAARDPAVRAGRRAGARARARRRPRARAGARAPRARRPGRRARVPRGRRGARRRARSAGSTRRSTRSARHDRAPARGSPSTATTTSTASARRRSSCARCATLGADVDWFLPSRHRRRLRAVGARPSSGSPRAGRELLVTVDCAITAVEEVAAARAAGLDVVVTDHHAPRADGALPDAPIVHPAVCGYPCPDLCADRRRVQARAGAARGGRRRPGAADDDLDLVALATVADVRAAARREPPARARGPARAGRHGASPGCAR